MSTIGNILASHKKKYLVKRSYKDTYIYKNILKYLYPGQNTKFYASYQRLLNRALVKMGVDDLFNIKFLLVIATFALILLVTKTSLYQQANETIEDISSRSAMLFATDPGGEEKKKEEKKRKQQEREVFEYLKDRYKYEILMQNEVESVGSIAQDIQFKEFKFDGEKPDDVARRMYKKLIEYHKLQQTDYFGIVLLAVIACFMPEAFLFIRSYLIKYMIYNEYLQLEVTAIMVGKLEPIKVEEILNVLSDNSKYFKRYIDEVRYNYFDVKNGHGKAFDAVISKIANKELRYLMKTLQQAAESDLKITIENLENQRKSNKEFRNIREQNKLKKKDLLGILIILIVLGAVCVYAFAPFEQIMNSFTI